jgi:hypothetical protein
MGMDGTGAFPSQKRIASEAGLSLRTIREHIRYAVDNGWLERIPRRIGKTRNFRFGTVYMPRFPCDAIADLPETSWMRLPPGRKRREQRQKNRMPIELEDDSSGASDEAPGSAH